MNFKYPFLNATLAGLVSGILVLWLWKVNQDKIWSAQVEKVEETTQLLSTQIENRINEDVNTLKNLKSRLEITNGRFFTYWKQDASLIIDQKSSYNFIEWIDKSMIIRDVEPTQGNEEAIGLDISKLDYRRDDWEKARDDSVMNFTHWLELVQGPDAFLLDIPVYYQGVFQGTITGGLNLNEEFSTILEGLNSYHVELVDGRGTIFFHAGDSTGTEEYADITQEKTIRINDTNNDEWTLRVIPNLEFGTDQFFDNPYLNLALGLILSLLVAVSFYLMQIARIAQKSSKLANTKIRSLIESSPMGIYAIDEKGVVRDFWNTAAEEMLGWKREEALGQFMPHISEEWQNEFQALLTKTQREGELKNKEITRTRKDGSKIHMRLNAGYLVANNQGEDLMLAIVEDITQEIEYKNKLEDSVHEKAILLSEIHHRVKNNLAIIAGLIELQLDEVDNEETREILRETYNRIFSISGVHELLYRTENFTEITFEVYTVNLMERIRELFESEHAEIDFKYDFQVRNININQAIPLGLMLNELITNSFKHAFTDQKKGEIRIEMLEEGEQVILNYSDNGIGFDPEKFQQGNSLGLTLIKTLLDQLNAEYYTRQDNGFLISLKFEVKHKGAHSNM